MYFRLMPFILPVHIHDPTDKTLSVSFLFSASVMSTFLFIFVKMPMTMSKIFQWLQSNFALIHRRNFLDKPLLSGWGAAELNL